MFDLARRQHGVVSVGQLAALGMTRGAVGHRLRQDRLRAVHRGVYLVGPVWGPRTRDAAALLAVGRAAVLSHRSAGALWGLLRADGDADAVDVTVAGRQPGARAGVRVHRVRTLDPCEVATRDGLAVTTPARTLLDLSAVVPARDLARALEEAELQRVVRVADLQLALRRHRGHRGIRALRAALDARREPRLTRSRAEARLLELVLAAGFPMPETSVRVGRHEVDLLWRAQRLVVEVDGYAFHGSRAAFERDRRRDADLLAAGHRVLRVTWRHLDGEPEAVVARLATALAR